MLYFSWRMGNVKLVYGVFLEVKRCVTDQGHNVLWKPYSQGHRYGDLEWVGHARK